MFEALHFQYFLGGLVSLITITNPPSKMPLFISLTQGMSEERRRQQANWAGIYAAAIMLVSLVCGNVLLAFFGISYGAMRIAGGLVVAAIGYQMLFGGNSPNKAPIVQAATARTMLFSPLPCLVSQVPARSLWSSVFLPKLQSSRAISIWLSRLHGRALAILCATSLSWFIALFRCHFKSPWSLRNSCHR